QNRQARRLWWPSASWPIFFPASSALAPVPRLDVTVDDADELLRDVLAAQRDGFLAVDEHRCSGRFAGAGQRDADVGVLALAGAVDYAAHDRERQVFGARVADLPFGHARADVVLHRLREFLEETAGRAAAAGARGDQWRECAQAHRLQQFLRDNDFLRSR